MSLFDWLALVSSVSSWAVVGATFIGRDWVKARIEKGVQFSFDNKLETLRAEMRKNEEAFKADLRNKETEISLLRSSVLSGSANRQALLDKRRFEAAEKVWNAVHVLTPLKNLSNMMSVIKFKELAKQSDNPNVKQFISMIGLGAGGDTLNPANLQHGAQNEQLYLSELAWALFSAYTTILYGALARFKILEIGSKDIVDVLTNEPTKKILKAALPHYSKFVDEQEPETYYFLLEEIEAGLLAELRRILEGQDADKDAAKRAKAIMSAIDLSNLEQQKEKVEAVGLA